MKYIKDVLYQTKIHEKDFRNKTSYIGKIVIDEDNSFEGIMLIEDLKYLVFGNLNKNNLELYLSSNHDERIPKMCICQRNNDSYIGKYYEKRITEKTNYKIGDCKIDVLDPFYYREVREDEEKRIDTSIKEFKEYSLGNKSKTLYKSIMKK